MSLLFPLYALGALALVAPILFHLFQRKPHGKQEFSSLMFLESTPPKLTRRSRLSDLLLLLLRALALLLLAAAFARPFLRSTSLLDLEAPSRSVALLVDTSASLRRDGLWEELKKSIDEVVDDLRPSDEVMLVSYDREPTTLVSFETWEEMEPSRRLALIKQQVAGLQPSWFETDLSAAAIGASDALLQQRLTENLGQPLQVIVFSDMQKGSELSGLQSYQWPEEITVDVRTVTAKKRTNASMTALPPEASEMDATQVRVLVRNEADSARGQFQVQWESGNAEAVSPKPVEVYVPPGQTRVIRVTQPRGAQELSLMGDDNVFDNQLYLTETTRQQQKLWYIGDDKPDDKLGLYFYLRQTSLDTRLREVAIEQLDDLKRLATVVPQQVPLCVLAKPLTGDALTDVKRYVSRGGRVLIVLTEGRFETGNETLTELLGLADVEVTDYVGQDYAMLANIDFQHPLFAPFADPRFNDFTKVRFWSHRVLATETEAPWTNIAKYEDGAPAFVEKQIEKGTVWVMTSGWQPKESQLALSTKFIPLLHCFYGHAGEVVNRGESFEVGHPIPMANGAGEKTSIVSPSGETFELAADSNVFSDASEPGIYRVQQGARQFSLAVNLPKAESQTEALMPDQLEQLGLSLGKQKTVDSMKTEQRQMRNKELEGNQKLWRWGILIALALIALETLLSSRVASAVYQPAGTAD